MEEAERKLEEADRRAEQQEQAIADQIGARQKTEREADSATSGKEGPQKPVEREEPKIGRNGPCPCGSGKKYKKCHGAGQV